MASAAESCGRARAVCAGRSGARRSRRLSVSEEWGSPFFTCSPNARSTWTTALMAVTGSIMSRSRSATASTVAATMIKVTGLPRTADLGDEPTAGWPPGSPEPGLAIVPLGVVPLTPATFCRPVAPRGRYLATTASDATRCPRAEGGRSRDFHLVYKAIPRRASTVSRTRGPSVAPGAAIA